MGCCCFNTLRGAAFFVASIHIYNGLECMLKFIAFPMVFSAMHNKDAEPTPLMAFLPGMVYAIVYFLLGCAIFRGIETEAIGAVKWSAVGFAITEVVFFILRVVLGIVPTPTVPDIKGDQPFEWNIYKTLNYFLFTIVGGLVYICILFLYVQKLSTGRDEFAQLASFLNANRPQAQTAPPSSNNNTTAQPNNTAIRTDHSHHKSSKPRDPERKPSSKGDSSERKPRPPGPGNPQPPPQGVVVGAGGNGGKEPPSPGSPMFPYFLLRRNSKMNASNKSGGGGPGPQDRMVVEEAPQGNWHQPRGGQGVSLLNRQEFDGPPCNRGDVGVGGGRNLLSPSMLNHHQPPLPPPHGFQPIPPPFYSDSGDEQRRESFIPGGFVSPTGSHYQAGYGRGGESLYQKIPMSPGFDYCLR